MNTAVVDIPAHFEITPEGEAVNGSLVSLFEKIDRGASKYEIRQAMLEVEAKLLEIGQEVDNTLAHKFIEGLYVRHATVPAFTVFSTGIYKEDCVLTILKGDIVILGEDGISFKKAGDYVFTKPGTKRIIFTGSDVEAHTVHPNPTNSNDVKELERRIYTMYYPDIEVTP